jgi:hypothetical protein
MVRIRELEEMLRKYDADSLVSGDITVYSGRPHEIHLADTEAHRSDVYIASSSGGSQ